MRARSCALCSTGSESNGSWATIGQDLSGVAILDLPDVDSVRIEHRATVDALLPRIDAVAWVVDPEKYDDERLHEYLRASRSPFRPDAVHLQQSRSTRSPSNEQMLAADLRRRLAADGIERAEVMMVSASDGSGVEELRSELSRAADGKAIIAAKLATDATTEVAEDGPGRRSHAG